MTKSLAFSIHLIISLAVVSFVYFIIRFQLYPDFYFPIQGISEIILLLFLVDVVLGPLLTLIVYKPEKKSLKFDLSVIATIQLAALTYGTHTIYQERPLSSLLVNNHFEIQPASSYDLTKVDPNRIDTSFISTPDFHVFLPPPNIQIEMTVNAYTGREQTKDYLLETEYYHSPQEQKQRVEKAALSIEMLSTHFPDLEVDTDKYFYIHILGKAGGGLARLNKQSYEIIDVVSITTI